MIALFRQPRKVAVSTVVARLVAVLALGWLAACAPVGGDMTSGAAGPRIDPDLPVPVALILPAGSSGDDLIARSLENSARMAMADLSGAQIDLRVYRAGPGQSASAAATAVNEGAKIILGPLRAEEATSAGNNIAGSGINMLAFSNNPAIAGGNVFILGPTFDTVARRLVSYGMSQGIRNYLVVHSNDTQGEVGRAAIVAAVRDASGTITGEQGYALSQQGILSAAPAIAAQAQGTPTQAVFLTAGVNADLPLLATALPERGVDPSQYRYMGLTRWDAASQALSLPGLQGGVFAVPDQAVSDNFAARYRAAYGADPHPLAGLAYDGIAAIGALVAQGNPNALTRSALTQGQGFRGTSGVFRLRPDGTNDRGLAVAQIRNNQVVIVDPAPRSFGGAGF